MSQALSFGAALLTGCVHSLTSRHWTVLPLELPGPEATTGNSPIRILFNVSLIKRRKASESLWFPFHCTRPGSERDSWVTESARQKVIRYPVGNMAGWKCLAIPGSHFLYGGSCAQWGRPTRKASEGINHCLKDIGFIKPVVELWGCQERGSWEDHQDKERCTAPTSGSPQSPSGCSQKPGGPKG